MELFPNVVAVLVVLLVERSAANEKVFFPGKPPKLSKGVLEIDGYYAEADQPSVLLTDLNDLATRNLGSPDSEPRRLSLDQSGGGDEETIESRFLFNGLNNNNNMLSGNNQPLGFFQPFSPFVISDTATVTRVNPPICVACTCLQGAQTCQAAGGVQLITVTVTAAAANGIGAVTALNAIACSPAPGALAVGATATLSCIVPPPAGLSVCDPSCRSNTGQGATACSANPSTANCPQFPAPAVCNTPCQNLAIGATVTCNAALPAVISARPSSACPNRKKREPQTSLPEIESSIDSTATGQRKGRLFGLQIAKTTITRTITVQGTVTATYIASGNCLPSNILAAPNC